MPDPIRVILVDDQSLVRSGFRMLIESEDDMEVVAEASNGLEALDVLRRMPVDVASWTSGCRRWTVSRPLDASRRPHWIPRC
ncbi:DNA-binding response regulator [Cutibacterium acnes JCM 18909]|nr:DNA-binding response regulator [Cutibacterium acnes JCM 18909]